MRNYMTINGIRLSCGDPECIVNPRTPREDYRDIADARSNNWVLLPGDHWLCPRCEGMQSQGVHGLELDPDGIDAHAPGAKLDAGKNQAGVLGQFSRALLAVAEVGTHGAEKYSRGGWQSVDKGIERYGDAGWRHKLKGTYEELDPDSGLKHKAHEAWNILAELELILRGENK